MTQLTSKTEKTRHQIIDAAERLFAENGFRGMTLRDVTHKAGVNLAAVNYHFGSKQDLMAAMLKNKIAPINQERLRRLDALSAKHAPDPIPLESIFDVLLRPVFEVAARSDEGKRFLRIMGRAISEPADFMRSMHSDIFKELVARFVQELSKTCPELPETELRLRLLFAVDTMIGNLVAPFTLETISQGKVRPDHFETILDGLLSFVVAGFRQAEAAGEK